MKAGIKLPTNDKQWENANEYFKANINCGEVSTAEDVNNCIENFNEIVYNYCADNHGKVDSITDIEKELIQRYKDFSKKQLKTEIMNLKKDRNSTPESI